MEDEGQKKMQQYMEDAKEFCQLVEEMRQNSEKLNLLFIKVMGDENHVLTGHALSINEDFLKKVKTEGKLFDMRDATLPLLDNQYMKENWLKWSHKERALFFFQLSFQRGMTL